MRKGFALVELLIIMAIMISVMTLVARYLAEQRDLTVRTQARTEVQDRVRMVMQLVTQDLQVVGSRSYVDSSNNINFSVGTTCTFVACLETVNSGVLDSFTAEYVGKLWSSSMACRSVSYSFDSTQTNTLLRSDVVCGIPPNPPTPDPKKLASNILALDIQYRCSDNTSTVNNSTDCASGSYPRSAKVTVIGKSPVAVSNIAASSFTTVSGTTVSCSATYICMSLTQEVIMPNLKD